MPASVRIQVFGRFSAQLEPGVNVSFRTNRAAEVVARLCLQKTSRISRTELAEDIWPDVERTVQLNNLRPALSYARKAIGQERIHQYEGDLLGLNSVESDWQDALQRERSTLSSSSTEDRVNNLLRLNYQIQKPLLFGWDSEWIEPFRDYHERLRLNILRLLAEEFGSRGDWDSGLEFAERILEIDPHSEVGIRLTMRFMVQTGRSAESVQVFKNYRSKLREELGLQVPVPLTEYAKSILSHQPETLARPLTSLQQEFIQDLFRSLLDSDPKRLMTLLASQSLNWEVIKHGPELLPLLEQALARVPGWSDDHSGVMKRLLMCYNQLSDWENVKKYANVLSQNGSVTDRIAALNYLGIAEVENGRFAPGRANYREAIDLAKSINHDYLASVSISNLSGLLLFEGQFSEAINLLASEREVIARDESMAGRYALAQHMMLHFEALVLLKSIHEAKAFWESFQIFVEANGIARHFEASHCIASSLYIATDPSLAVESCCRSIEAVLAQRTFSNWEQVAAFSIKTLNDLGRHDSAGHLTHMLFATANASRKVICPAWLTLLPTVKGKRVSQPHDWRGLLLEIRDNLRRI